MAINVSHTMSSFNFEHKENLRNAAKNILNKQGATAEISQKVLEQVVFPTSNKYVNPQLAIISASTQISLNNTLKETLKYLKTQANKKATKDVILGELWNIFQKEECVEYNGELVDFEIDFSAKNIFIAA